MTDRHLPIKYNGVKLPSQHTLSFLNTIFSDYTTLWQIRKLQPAVSSDPVWLEYLDIISNDMMRLVEMNLTSDLVTVYKIYVRDNDWSNDLSIRRSCKNIDKAVEFLKIHFYQQLNGATLPEPPKPAKPKHLKVVK